MFFHASYLFPETKAGVAQALATNLKIGKVVNAPSAPTFIKDTSTKTNKY